MPCASRNAAARRAGVPVPWPETKGTVPKTCALGCAREASGRSFLTATTRRLARQTDALRQRRLPAAARHRTMRRLAQGVPTDHDPLRKTRHPFSGHALSGYDPALPTFGVLKQSLVKPCVCFLISPSPDSAAFSIIPKPNCRGSKYLIAAIVSDFLHAASSAIGQMLIT